MVEHAEQSFTLPTSVVPVRKFVRGILKTNHEPRPFTDAVIAFIDSEFYITQEVGRPEYHAGLAVKLVDKLNLPAEERTRAQRLAHDLLIAFGQSTINPNVNLTQEAITMLEEKRRADEEKRRKARIARKTTVLREKFASLMEPSDIQLRINNSNARIDLTSDTVFQEMNKPGKTQFIQRAIPEQTYEEAMVTMLAKQNTVVLNTYNLPPHLVAKQIQGFRDHSIPTKQRLGEEKFANFITLLQKLASGEPVAKADIIQAGLPVDMVITQARKILLSVNFDTNEREGRISRLIRDKTKWASPLQQDPNLFLEDGSHRNTLGYIQWSQELRD